MARRDSTPQDDERKSYGAVWLVCSLLLLVGALWAVARRQFLPPPVEEVAGGLQPAGDQPGRGRRSGRSRQRLDADPAYQEAVKRLDTARAEVDSGATAGEIARLEQELEAAVLADQSKDLNLRFVKSELEELRFFFDDAKHHGRADRGHPRADPPEGGGAGGAQEDLRGVAGAASRTFAAQIAAKQGDREGGGG